MIYRKKNLRSFESMHFQNIAAFFFKENKTVSFYESVGLEIRHSG
jgi:hypothetical protein